MNIKQLREAIADLPDDMPILMEYRNVLLNALYRIDNVAFIGPHTPVRCKEDDDQAVKAFVLL